ncbi:MAG: translation initiation factor IF-2 associated domain-containing protein, partial [Hyphomicrobium sp.]
MSETKDTADKTILGRARKPLSLQRTVESGHVRQNFSHGRSKSVVVEKRRTRKLAGPGAAQEAKPALQEAKPAASAPKKKPVKAETATPELAREAPGIRALSEEERDARARALAAAKVQEDAKGGEKPARAAPAAPTARGVSGAEGATSRPPLNPAMQAREGGRPRKIDFPTAPPSSPSRAKPEPETPKRSARAAVAVTRDEDESRGSPRGRKAGPRTP